MRHHVNTQSSLAYDIETNNRQIALAHEFAARFASGFQPAMGGAGPSGQASGSAGGDDGEGWTVINGFWDAKLASSDQPPAEAGKRLFHLIIPVDVFTSRAEGDTVKFDAPGGDGTVYRLPAIPADGAISFPLSLDMSIATGESARVTEIKLRKPKNTSAPAPEEDAFESHLDEANLTADDTLTPEALVEPMSDALSETGPAPNFITSPEPAAVANSAIVPELANDPPSGGSPVSGKGGATPAAPNRLKRTANRPARLESWKTPRAAANAPTPMTDELSIVVGGIDLKPADLVEAMGAGPGGRDWFCATVVALRGRFPPIHVKYTATLGGVKHRLSLPEPVTAYLHADDVRRIA